MCSSLPINYTSVKLVNSFLKRHSGLHNGFSTSITPFDIGGILLLEGGDELPIHY